MRRRRPFTRAAALIAAALLTLALALAAPSPPRRPRGLSAVQAPRRDLRGEPQLRQPVREWGEVNGQHVEGLADAGRRTRPRSPRTATAYRCLLQNDVNLTSPPLPPTTCSATPRARRCRDSALRATRRSRIDDYIDAGRHDLPGAERLRRPTACSRAPGCPAAAPATWSTASTRSSTRSTAAGRTAT